ncbi:phosphonate ABC transporter ATP-binding protein [bacterium]|nr:phosphonate ABC transporter ATP-binding protein [bacterium]
MRTPLLVLLLLGGAATARAVPVTFRVALPPGTPPDAPVHLACDYQGWRPDAADWRLTRRDDGTAELTVDLPAGHGLQYKFALGSWLAVEKGPDGEEIANRLHVVGAAPETLDLVVAGWADGRPARRVDTISGDVTTHTVPGFLDGRRVWVYLPPGYAAEGERRYPVLYMADGQNVFNDATSFVGEWRVDETLEELIPAGRVAPLIVVAVDHGGGARTREYTPWPSRIREGSGGGPDHLQAWIDVLKPWVDGRYRTRSGPAHTALAGSSLGGLMTLYGTFAHPEVFGRGAAFSPSLLIAGHPVFDLCATAPGRPDPLYVDMGTREEGNRRDGDGNGTDDYVDALRRLADVLQERGYVGGWDLLVVEGEGDRHNEAAWAARFPAAVEFLFPPAP